MSIIDLIKKRKNIICQESEGITLATHTINDFEDRTFTLKGLKNKHCGLNGQDIFKHMENELDIMLILYHFTTKVKTYIDKKGISQAEIKIIGNASTMNRYNPLDIELEIKTEIQNK